LASRANATLYPQGRKTQSQNNKASCRANRFGAEPLISASGEVEIIADFAGDGDACAAAVAADN